jgi:hypothetical protein
MTGLLAGIVGQLLLPAANPAGFGPFWIITMIIAIASVLANRRNVSSSASIVRRL